MKGNQAITQQRGKGTMARPETIHRKLEAGDIPIIFELAAVMKYSAVAEKYDVSTETIRKVVQRKRYIHVDVDPGLIEKAQRGALRRKQSGKG